MIGLESATTDGERFELSIPLQVCRFSRPVHSTTLPPVQDPLEQPDKLLSHLHLRKLCTRSALFVAQCFDGVQPSGSHGWHDAKQNARDRTRGEPGDN